MAYTKVSVLKSGNNPGRPAAYKSKIILFDWDDVLTVPARDESGVKITGDLVMKTGLPAIEIEVTNNTLKAFDTSEGDPDKKGFLHNLEFEHPGDSLTYAEFVENNINKNLGAVVQKCDGTNKRMLGTPCSPLQLQHEGQNDSDAVTNMVKLVSLLRGPKIAHYEGADPTVDTDSGA